MEHSASTAINSVVPPGGAGRGQWMLSSVGYLKQCRRRMGNTNRITKDKEPAHAERPSRGQDLPCAL